MMKSRFAPSPTGQLHIGNARTALFAWLSARQAGGAFLLRIEDTDTERSTQESVDGILEAMSWIGLDYDEGPVYQTDRLARYKEVVEKWLEEGRAYRCACTPERLDALRASQMEAKQKPRYDGHCRNQDVSAEQPHVIRFRQPDEGNVSWDDQVKGSITIANSELDDLILVRTDGMPTYNLTVVIDDMDMGVTHVVRGDDHVNNTPRQINLYHALGATPPTFAHVPTILGPDGKRLSKRHGAATLLQYRDAGFHPEALLNYLVRLGWSHGDQEIFSKEEMVSLFSLEKIQGSPAMFSEEKCLWLNQHYMKVLPVDVIAKRARSFYEQAGIALDEGPALEAIIPLFQERTNTLCDLVEQTTYFFKPVTEYEEKAAKKHLKSRALEPLSIVKEKLEALTEWSASAIHEVLTQTAEQLELGMGKVGMPFRVGITGVGNTPAINEVAFLLGRECVLERLEIAIPRCA